MDDLLWTGTERISRSVLHSCISQWNAFINRETYREFHKKINQGHQQNPFEHINYIAQKVQKHIRQG